MVNGVAAGTFTNIAFANTAAAHREVPGPDVPGPVSLRGTTSASTATTRCRYATTETTKARAPTRRATSPSSATTRKRISAERNFPTAGCRPSSVLGCASGPSTTGPGRAGDVCVSGMLRVDSGRVFSLAQTSRCTSTQIASDQCGGIRIGRHHATWSSSAASVARKRSRATGCSTRRLITTSRCSAAAPLGQVRRLQPVQQSEADWLEHHDREKHRGPGRRARHPDHIQSGVCLRHCLRRHDFQQQRLGHPSVPAVGRCQQRRPHHAVRVRHPVR